MTQTINRMYQVRENADAAVTELKRTGFADDAINVAGPADAPDEEILASIRQGGVAATHAVVFAEGIKRGETLISVQAAFGCAGTVIAILQKHSPTDAGLPEQGYDKPPRDPATPLSSACGWIVLINNPTPLSSYLGWRVLSTEQPKRKPDSELVDNPAPFSKKINLTVLTVLTDRPTILSSRFGWPVLSKDQNPPPVRFGLRLLSDNPAPLSARLGWKLLSNDPAPLSRLFGLPVLWDASEKKSARSRVGSR